MKKLFIAAFIFVSTFTTNVFAEVKMGIILGFTGPIESLTPDMAAGAELAIDEVNKFAILPWPVLNCYVYLHDSSILIVSVSY